METMKGRGSARLRQRSQAREWIRCLGLIVALVGIAAAAQASSDEKTVAAAEEAPVDLSPVEPSAVDLDRLLTLPETFDPAGSERRGGATAEQWRARFLEVDEDLQAAREALDAAQAELEALAEEGGQWNVAAPGATDAENGPMSFKLRNEIKRQREALDAAQKRRRELEVEANLADVPESWRN